MTKAMWWLAINGGFAASMWFGFVEGVEGAQYLAKFWVWAVAAPMSMMAFTDAMQKKLAAEPPQPILSRVQNLIAWAALGVFIWHGHIATAIAWAFWMLAAAVCREGVKKHRAGPTAAPAT